MNRWILNILFLTAAVAYGGYDATITWKASEDPDVSTMRIYQITQSGGSVAGYSSFPYENLKGTFELAVGCVDIYARAYNEEEGLLSNPSNILSIGCVCPDCKTEPSGDTLDGEIMGLDEKTLIFNGTSGITYDIYERQSLTNGDWKLVGSHNANINGVVGYVIDTTQHTSCFYTVRSR